ncbi:MAG: hypothetical protein KBF52_07655 [Pyrinomonadaceae bacterium]|nr:hypothetical protein [Chloracidobacterium sp.]MBP9935633.1 hypothetical protein [Pyrinomonadaceae bacterium]
MLKKAIVLIGLAMSLAASAAGQRSDDRTAVLAVVKQLFAEMAAANPVGIIAVGTPENQLVALFKQKDGKSRMQVISREAFAKMFADKTKVMEEVMYAPNAEVSGDWAMVWGRYVYFASGKLTHCGINQFNLVRTGAGWKIANGASVIDPDACTEEEKAIIPSSAIRVKPSN